MIQLNDLIHVYDDVIDLNVCNFLIEFFESQSENHEHINNDFRPKFAQLNLTNNAKISEEVNNVHNYLISKTFEYRNLYCNSVDKRVFPEKNNCLEYYRIKKYCNNGEDCFETHVDVQDYESARRYLSFMFYLNDVETGGETIFTDLTITPKAGKLVIFPPLWMYPHKGCHPVSDNKYILTTYLHYV
jgi:hypothetical protein